jgi:hypothetical protein
MARIEVLAAQPPIMTHITETSAYERHLLLVEGKPLNEWNNMAKEEREQTESFRFMVETLQNCNEAEIAEQEKLLEDSDLVDGELESTKVIDGKTYNSWKPWNCRGATKERLETCKARNYEESAHERLDEVITRLTEESDDGHFVTITNEERHERGFQIMEDNDWKYVYIQYSGGHDSGGIDEARIDLKDGTAIDIGWEAEALLAVCPRILSWMPGHPSDRVPLDLDHDIDGQDYAGQVIGQADRFFDHRPVDAWGNRFYWHSPCRSLAAITDNPFMDPIDDQFSSWAGDWQAHGQLEWDNRKKIDGKGNPDYRKRPSLEFDWQVYEAQSVPV